MSDPSPEQIAEKLAQQIDAIVNETPFADIESLAVERLIVAAFQEVLRLSRSPPETCICAAIRLEGGEVFRGHRHDDAIRTASKCDMPPERLHNAEQGFITSAHRFVSREEGARLQRAAGIPSAHTKALPNGMLFSEDLYLRSTNGMPLGSLK